MSDLTREQLEASYLTDLYRREGHQGCYALATQLLATMIALEAEQTARRDAEGALLLASGGQRGVAKAWTDAARRAREK